VIEEYCSDSDSTPKRAALSERQSASSEVPTKRQSASSEVPTKRQKTSTSTFVKNNFQTGSEKALQRSKVPNKFKDQTKQPEILLTEVQRNSQKTPFGDKVSLNILRNQLVRAHTHSLLELVYKFEDFRKNNPYNKDPTWFLKKSAIDLYIFSDELKGLSKLSEKEREKAATSFEELVDTQEEKPFCNFKDPRKELSLSERLSE
jgi:hypothetical protein